MQSVLSSLLKVKARRQKREEFNITKQSTIWVQWKFLLLLYKRVAGKNMNEVIEEQVSEFILGPFSPGQNLDTSLPYANPLVQTSFASPSFRSGHQVY
ncbi:hypothetical protein AJ79_08292 [Helicocarpus griseus UAMH5409]|uniref:Uncharacterized protein n=1 Tax=Helicocarpus griseus UAMH5409 TaxID=1447875 RepID=A0A2B7WUG7_9EURO|nr:hypothetical protein AJ79_08292 [Helicocarpus griseus UAMH5409]